MGDAKGGAGKREKERERKWSLFKPRSMGKGEKTSSWPSTLSIHHNIAYTYTYIITNNDWRRGE